MKTARDVRREAERFIKKHGVGGLPGRRFDNGESAERQTVGAHHGDASRPSRDDGDDLPRHHREHTSYSQFESLDAWESWLIDEGVEYAAVVGQGHATLEQLEKRARMRHILTFLLPMHIDLLFAVHVEGRTESEVAKEFGVTQQAISKRLKVAEQDFRRAFGEHWNDPIDIDLSVEEGV